MSFKLWGWVFLVGVLILIGCEAGIRNPATEDTQTQDTQTLDGRIVVPTTESP